MVSWIEYAIARHGAQLRALAVERPLSNRELDTAEVCEIVISKLEVRESQHPAERPPRRRSSARLPLAKFARRD